MQLLWFELSALLLLISFLIWSRWQHAKRFARLEKILPPAHGMDTTLVQIRLQQVRQDYQAAAALRNRSNPNRDLVVMAVRHSLAKLSYFRSAKVRSSDTIERNPQENEA